MTRTDEAVVTVLLFVAFFMGLMLGTWFDYNEPVVREREVIVIHELRPPSEPELECMNALGAAQECYTMLEACELSEDSRGDIR